MASWFPAGATTTWDRFSGSNDASTISSTQLGGPNSSGLPTTGSASGSVGNAKPTLITSALRCSQSERATDASVGIGVSESSRSTNAPLWLTTVMAAVGQTCATTPATKFACATSAS